MISPQGYNYGNDPKSDNPFWTDDEIKEEITATATVDNTTGTPSVDVTKNGYNFDFSFHNLKGEKGDNGVNGQNGQDGKNGINGISPVVTSTGDTGSGKVAGTITGADGTIITVYNGESGASGSTEPELQPWAPVTGAGNYTTGWPINYTQTVQNCNAESTVTVTLRSVINAIQTYKTSSRTRAEFNLDPLRTGYTDDVKAGQLATYPSFIIPYVGEALSNTSHINHTFYGANDYSIQSPILELSVTPVFNSDGSATFTITIKGFYMNKITNETVAVGATADQNAFPLLTISLKE